MAHAVKSRSACRAGSIVWRTARTFARSLGRSKNFFADALVPGLGAVFCLMIWWGLATPAKIAGGIWFAVGLLHTAIRTRGFQTRPVMIDFSES